MFNRISYTLLYDITRTFILLCLFDDVRIRRIFGRMQRMQVALHLQVQELTRGVSLYNFERHVLDVQLAMSRNMATYIVRVCV